MVGGVFFFLQVDLERKVFENIFGFSLFLFYFFVLLPRLSFMASPLKLLPFFGSTHT
jgi:hypothetical protein